MENKEQIVEREGFNLMNYANSGILSVKGLKEQPNVKIPEGFYPSLIHDACYYEEDLSNK